MVLYKYIGGSHLYGFADDSSDSDDITIVDKEENTADIKGHIVKTIDGDPLQLAYFLIEYSLFDITPIESHVTFTMDKEKAYNRAFYLIAGTLLNKGIKGRDPYSMIESYYAKSKSLYRVYLFLLKHQNKLTQSRKELIWKMKRREATTAQITAAIKAIDEEWIRINDLPVEDHLCKVDYTLKEAK